MCIWWTGPNFQEMIEYFKGYKMKYIKLRDSSIMHTNEMREFLMQSESISFKKVLCLHPERTLNPSQEKILTKQVEYFEVSESIVNI